MENQSILVQKNQFGKVKFIQLELDGDTMTSTWGLVGGRTQEVSNTYDYINFGKSNELSPEQAAEADFKRKRDRKIKEGYTEVDSLDDLDAIDEASELDVMDFANPPTSFAPSKPHNKSLDEAKLHKLFNNGKLIVQDKENGLCHFIFVDSDLNVSIYTRRMDDHTGKYPGMVESVKDLITAGKIKKDSVLAVEFVVDHKDHMEAFTLMQRISKSDTNKGQLLPSQEKSLAIQSEHPVRGCVFMSLYDNGAESWKLHYGAMYDLLSMKFQKKDTGATLFYPTQQTFDDPESMVGFLKKYRRGMEGFVLWHIDQSPEVAFSGKPKRRAAWKLKIPLETDVIAYDYVEGSGDQQGKIGALLIGKYDADGAVYPLGRVGSGFKDWELEIDYWDFPQVIQIEYAYQYPTGKFQHPVFIKKHEDKLPEDCVLEEDEVTK